MRGKKHDLIGKRFGRLLVTGCMGKDKNGAILWNCRCDCGNETIVRGSILVCGKQQSCGCLGREFSSLRLKKCNEYDLSGQCGKAIAGTGETFLFDKEDIDKIKEYFWRVSKPSKNHPLTGGYVVSNSIKRKQVNLSRLIMNCPEDLIVDHINHDKLDNRKENLRICTFSENQRNRRFKGVSFHRRQGKYYARITVNKVTINLGSFDTFEEAKTARLKAQEKYFGEFGCMDQV